MKEKKKEVCLWRFRDTHLHGLINISDVLCLNICVLLGRVHQLGKSSEQTFDTDSRHIHELARDKGY